MESVKISICTFTINQNFYGVTEYPKRVLFCTTQLGCFTPSFGWLKWGLDRGDSTRSRPQMASRRLRPRWPRRTFPGGSEASRVPSFPSWCLFHHPAIRNGDSYASVGVCRESAVGRRRHHVIPLYESKIIVYRVQK